MEYLAAGDNPTDSRRPRCLSLDFLSFLPALCYDDSGIRIGILAALELALALALALIGIGVGFGVGVGVGFGIGMDIASLAFALALRIPSRSFRSC